MARPVDCDPLHQFTRAERPLPRRTPDVDAEGFQHQQPDVAPGERPADEVVAHLVVGRHQHRVCCRRRTDGVQAGGNDVAHAPDPPARLAGTQVIAAAKFRRYARHRAGRGLQPFDETGDLFRDSSTAGGGWGTSTGGLIAAVSRFGRGARTPFGRNDLPDAFDFELACLAIIYLQHAIVPPDRASASPILATASFSNPSDLTTVSRSNGVMPPNTFSSRAAMY